MDLSLEKSKSKWFQNESFGRRILQNLEEGIEVSNLHFDALLSPRARSLSRRHWTPISVAMRAAELLTEGKRRRVLDIGSGVGKFCIVGASTTPAYFTGVEQRRWLVEESSALSATLKVERAQFLNQSMASMNWSEFDAFYFFNPFHENLDDTAQIDNQVPLGAGIFDSNLALARYNLGNMKVGTRVATYHGLGGPLPREYTLEVREPFLDDFLELWVKG